MAGRGGSDSGGSKKGSGSTGEGTADSSSNGNPPSGEEGRPTEGEEGSGEPDTADTGGGAGGAAAKSAITPAATDVPGRGTNPQEKTSYFLIHENLVKEECFAVIQRESIGDIARVVKELPEAVIKTCVIIRGTHVEFGLNLSTVFTCDGEEVKL